jgi:hypothetical protein
LQEWGGGRLRAGGRVVLVQPLVSGASMDRELGLQPAALTQRSCAGRLTAIA